MGGKKHTTHICLMACEAAGINAGLVPQLEELYHIDFMASDDKTGNASAGGDWKMETDAGFDISAMYFEKEKLMKYRQAMMRNGYAFAGGMAGAGLDAACGGASCGALSILGGFIGSQYD